MLNVNSYANGMYVNEISYWKKKKKKNTHYKVVKNNTTGYTQHSAVLFLVTEHGPG